MVLELKRRSGESGFSLIEALLASLLLVIVILALVPLFAQSMQNTLAGREYSVASQHGRSLADEYYQLPLDGEELLLPVGESVLEGSDWWDGQQHLWVDTAPTFSPGGALPPAWRRDVTVRQYNVNDLLEEGRLANPLDGGSPAPQVHLREVIVEVESERSGGGAREGRTATLTTVRGF